MSTRMWGGRSFETLAYMDSKLQELFVRRLSEELEARMMSTHAVVRIAKTLGHKIGKSSVARILAGKQDPTLRMVHIFSEVLGLPSWTLLMETGQIEQRVIRPIPQNVVKLPEQYSGIFRQSEVSAHKKVRARYKKKSSKR